MAMDTLKLVMMYGVMSLIVGGAAVAQQAGGPAGQNTPTSNTAGSRPSPTNEQTTGGGGMTNSERSPTTGQASQGGKMQSQMPIPKQNERPEQPGK
jgi:hypothetical protein